MSYWCATVGESRYTITVDGHLVRLTKDKGTPESFGANDVPIARFLRSKDLRQHVKSVFGEATLNEVLSAAGAGKGAPNA